MNNDKTLLHHLLKRKELSKNDFAIQFKDEGRWLRYRWSEYYSLIEAVGASLTKMGTQRGDHIAIISDNRPEWVIADLAILGLGAITVPVYTNSLNDDVLFIINDAKVKIVILEDATQLDKWIKIKASCPTVNEVIVLENKSEENRDHTTWAELLTKGREQIAIHPRTFSDEANRSTLQDVATIVYTSGTTGRPKGVVLTHEQIMSELTDIFSMVSLNHEDTCLSFLPYSHILGRVEAWGNVYTGYVLAFAESIDKIKANLKEVKPTFIISVPRIFEKIYAGILAQVENSKVKQKLFQKALAIGLKVSAATQRNESLGVALTLEYALFKKIIFDNILNAMGGKLRFAVSGGAPLNSEIAKFFHGMGLLICEGYGLTETTAGVFFNSPLAYKFGTVGRPLGDVEVKIADDGEILVRSKKIMKEYYNNPEATREVFLDGFFKTGDIGHLDKEGFLYITDRKKDLIKTAGGKYVAPQKLENLLKINPNISNVLIHGDQKKYIVALITLPSHLVSMANDASTYSLVKDAVAEANASLASYESIKKFAILPLDFTVESGELTPSLKVKRKFCDQKYKKEIDELY